jgi:ribosomal protein S18 acetylase RimI-like enzyme
MDTLRLEVEEANAAAIAFYEANGFRPAGRTADCGGNSGLPALIMEKRIR